MDLLNKLTIKNLKLNKKRTIVTIIGIMLSVALITAVATMYSSAIKSLINFETYHKGNYHIAFYDVNEKEIYKIEKNKGVEELYLTSNIGYAKLDNSKNEYKPYAYIKAFTNDALENLSIKLIKGRLPKNEKEILIPNHLKTNGRIDLKIGDEITLDVGKRINEEQAELNQYNPFIKEIKEEIVETTTKTYKIVGIIERPATNIENYEAPGYTFITYLDKERINGYVDVYAKFNKYGSKNYLNVAANVLDLDEEIFVNGYNHNFTEDEEKEYKEYTSELAKAKYQYDINGYLIMLENNPLDENATGGLGYAVLIVCIIIVITSVFCIKNSFDISITEKTKQYGMLRSIGATKKQIKRNVYYEGTILGIIGIPLGIVLGLIASYILIIVSNIFLKEMLNVNTGLKLVLSISWISILIAILLGIITIYLSALRSARKASIVSPINSIRNSADIKIKSNKIKSPKVINKLFGIGGEISYKNFKRNKKKYRTTVISIVVSVAVFIGLSYFISEAFNSVKLEIKTYDYNLALNVYDVEKEDIFMNTLNLNNIENYAIYKYNYLNLKNPKYNEDYIEQNNLDKNYINKDAVINILSIGDYQYKKYLRELNLDYDEYQNKAILVSNKIELKKSDEKTGKNKLIYVTQYDYKNGDILSLYNDYSKKDLDIKIGYITDKKPFGEEFVDVYLLISDKMFNEIEREMKNFSIYYQSNNPDKLQDDIDEMLLGEDYFLNNINEQSKMMNNLFTLVAIFLYGFIIVISLIGITNIFNTITTNMNLRKQEFAMLKSIGMTSKEFKKMIRLESVFIGAKSLLFGIPIGIGISYLIYHFMIEESNLPFTLPILAIIISIIVVYLLITILMKYSMNKINKENTIETIRNENI